MKKVDVITEKYVDVRRELKEILVNAVMSREEGLEKRIKYLDADLAEILREVGRESMEAIIHEVQDNEVKKNFRRIRC